MIHTCRGIGFGRWPCNTFDALHVISESSKLKVLSRDMCGGFVKITHTSSSSSSMNSADLIIFLDTGGLEGA